MSRRSDAPPVRLSAPLQLADLELTAPAELPVLRSSAAGVRLLVRYLGTPLGWADLSATDLRAGPGAVLADTFRRNADGVAREVVRRALAAPLPPSALEVAPLLEDVSPSLSEFGPTISVAICTRDRTADLAVCLEALQRLGRPVAELLVVDNAPTTAATEILVHERFPDVRYLREPRPGLDWARNRAAAEACGEIIAYTDDDVAVDADWLDPIVAAFGASPDVAAVTGFVAPLELETRAQLGFEEHRGYRHPSNFIRGWYRTEPGGGGAVSRFGAAGMFGSGANMAFRTRVLRELGGFDPALDVGTASRGGGDLEMFFRVLREGYILVREPAAVVRHRHRRTDAELRAQIATWGIGMHSYLLRTGEAYPADRAALRRLHLRWLLLRNPRRVLRALAGEGPRLDLVWAEMSRSALARRAYRQARREAERLATLFGSPPLMPSSGSPAMWSTHPSPPGRRRVAHRQVDVAEPLPSLEPVAGAADIQVSVAWAGREIGSVLLPGGAAGVPASWLRDVIAAELGGLILRIGGISLAHLRSACHAEAETHQR